MQAIGRMAEQIAVFVNRAALDGQLPAPERHECGFQAGGTVRKA